MSMERDFLPNERAGYEAGVAAERARIERIITEWRDENHLTHSPMMAALLAAVHGGDDV